MGTMSLDFGRLGARVKRERGARDWSQEELAAAAGVSLSSIQNVELARPFRRTPPTLKKIDKAFGWESGGCIKIARGGEPTLLESSGAPQPENGVDDGDAPATTARARALPTGVQAALDDGEVFATDVLTLPITGGKFHLVLVVTKGAYSSPEEKEVLRKQMEDWIKIQEGIRNIADLKIEP